MLVMIRRKNLNSNATDCWQKASRRFMTGRLSAIRRKTFPVLLLKAGSLITVLNLKAVKLSGMTLCAEFAGMMQTN